MFIDLTPDQNQFCEELKRFADEHLRPHADRFDSEERLSPAFIELLRGSRLLATNLPQSWGGRGTDMISYGLLHEEIGKVCSSVRSVITVHDMVAEAVLKWGNRDQQQRWLPGMARGELLGALAASEPNVGSDLSSVETTAELRGETYVLNGTKCWITGGQIADLFLVLARYRGEPTAFLVERGRAGFTTRPVAGLLGIRASMLAFLYFKDCAIPIGNLLGRSKMGLAAFAGTALGLGRYSVAWGSVGIAQACLDACVSYASSRRQFGTFIEKHQLIQQMISRMVVGVRAARLLCCHAGYLKDSGRSSEVGATFMAKYFASRMAVEAASDAVQVHGANGCSSDYPVQRYYRDAKIMEIIEGSTQMQEVMIASFKQDPHLTAQPAAAEPLGETR